MPTLGADVVLAVHVDGPGDIAGVHGDAHVRTDATVTVVDAPPVSGPTDRVTLGPHAPVTLNGDVFPSRSRKHTEVFLPGSGIVLCPIP